MPAERLVLILELLAQRERRGDHRGMLCAVACEITGLDGAGVALVASNDQLTAFCASDDVASALMDLEVIVGAGPGLDACATDLVVLDDDLVLSRNPGWLAYTPGAVDLGARAVFAFPIHIGAARLGALTFYRDRPGPLSDYQSFDAYLMASVIARAVLALQARAVQGSLSEELEGEATFDFLVHQAAGMVAVQGTKNLSDALVLLRAHAYALGCGLSELAGRVVAREIRYDLELDSWVYGVRGSS